MMFAFRLFAWVIFMNYLQKAFSDVINNSSTVVYGNSPFLLNPDNNTNIIAEFTGSFGSGIQFYNFSLNEIDNWQYSDYSTIAAGCDGGKTTTLIPTTEGSAFFCYSSSSKKIDAYEANGSGINYILSVENSVPTISKPDYIAATNFPYTNSLLEMYVVDGNIYSLTPPSKNSIPYINLDYIMYVTLSPTAFNNHTLFAYISDTGYSAYQLLDKYGNLISNTHSDFIYVNTEQLSITLTNEGYLIAAVTGDITCLATINAAGQSEKTKNITNCPYSTISTSLIEGKERIVVACSFNVTAPSEAYVFNLNFDLIEKEKININGVIASTACFEETCASIALTEYPYKNFYQEMVIFFWSIILNNNTAPSIFPTQHPTRNPTIVPTTFYPTPNPTSVPITFYPTEFPTIIPTATYHPTEFPTIIPSAKPSITLTAYPSLLPTDAPTKAPIIYPTAYPTIETTIAPTNAPTAYPSQAPTNLRTYVPTASPSQASTNAPTAYSTTETTRAPTQAPSFQTKDDQGSDDENEIIIIALAVILGVSLPCLLFCCAYYFYKKKKDHQQIVDPCAEEETKTPIGDSKEKPQDDAPKNGKLSAADSDNTESDNLLNRQAIFSVRRANAPSLLPTTPEDGSRNNSRVLSADSIFDEGEEKDGSMASNDEEKEDSKDDAPKNGKPLVADSDNTKSDDLLKTQAIFSVKPAPPTPTNQDDSKRKNSKVLPDDFTTRIDNVFNFVGFKTKTADQLINRTKEDPMNLQDLENNSVNPITETVPSSYQQKDSDRTYNPIHDPRSSSSSSPSIQDLGEYMTDAEEEQDDASSTKAIKGTPLNETQDALSIDSTENSTFSPIHPENWAASLRTPVDSSPDSDNENNLDFTKIYNKKTKNNKQDLFDRLGFKIRTHLTRSQSFSSFFDPEKQEIKTDYQEEQENIMKNTF